MSASLPLAMPAGRRIALLRGKSPVAILVYQESGTGKAKESKILCSHPKAVPEVIGRWVKSLVPDLLKRLDGCNIENVSFCGDPLGADWGFRFLSSKTKVVFS